jgi:membrane protein required for colicin V production
MSDLAVIDYIFIGLILLMIVHGYIKGLIEELFSWAAIILAIWLAVLLNPAAAAIVRERLMPNVRVVPEILAFAAVFIMIMLVIKLLERILKDVVAGANLGAVNKILGAVFGLVEGFAFTVLIIFVLLSVRPFFDTSKILGESIFAMYLLPVIKIPLERGQPPADPESIDSAVLFIRQFLPALENV